MPSIPSGTNGGPCFFCFFSDAFAGGYSLMCDGNGNSFAITCSSGKNGMIKLFCLSYPHSVQTTGIVLTPLPVYVLQAELTCWIRFSLLAHGVPRNCFIIPLSHYCFYSICPNMTPIIYLHLSESSSSNIYL